MRIRFSLVAAVMLLFVVVWAVSVITGYAALEPQRTDEVARAIIAREKAATEAWQRKDKAFYADYLSEDATYFGAMNPYLETDPRETLIPKFEQYAEMFKIIDFQMYNPRVQVYGDTAVLTYNSSAMVNMGGRPMHYTGKMTTVYARQGGTWRVVHGHESMNGGAPQ